MNFLKLAKSAPALALTCALGIALTQASRNCAPAGKGFTYEEARSHLHKRVRYNLKCQTCPVKDEQTTGRTIFFDKQGGEYAVAIDWDVSFRGRHEVIWFDKENYEKWVIETGPSED